MRLPIRTIMFVLVILLFTLLQKKLSKSRNPYLGLIIPFFSIMLTIALMLNATTPSETIMTLFFYSIPTVINLGIYFSCRKRVKTPKNSEIERMKIDDLE